MVECWLIELKVAGSSPVFLVFVLLKFCLVLKYIDVCIHLNFMLFLFINLKISAFLGTALGRRYSIFFFLLLAAIIYIDCYSVYSLFPNSFCDEMGGSAEQDGVESGKYTKEADETKAYALIIILCIASLAYLYFT